jgi:hypothetical protein
MAYELVRAYVSDVLYNSFYLYRTYGTVRIRAVIIRKHTSTTYLGRQGTYNNTNAYIQNRVPINHYTVRMRSVCTPSVRDAVFLVSHGWQRASNSLSFHDK